MPYRIFDTVLDNHSWSADGRLCIAQQRQSEPFEEASPEVEVDALFSRLLHRSRMERNIYRAAIRLRANPSIPLHQLAAELRVTECYLLSGLRSALSVDPQDFLRKAS